MSLSVLSDEHYMKEAIKMALNARDDNEIPVGAIVVCKNKIIARGFNQTERLVDSTAHAEMLAITAAFDHLGAKYLPDCALYVTLEPCPMCAGAAFWAQIGRLIYGARDLKRGYSNFNGNLLHPKTEIVPGVMAAECEELLDSFFKSLRN